MNRYDAREYALSLLFASDFHPQTPYDQLYEDMTQDEILQADAYIADVASHCKGAGPVQPVPRR